VAGNDDEYVAVAVTVGVSEQRETRVQAAMNPMFLESSGIA
jgi:hypothetical protein